MKLAISITILACILSAAMALLLLGPKGEPAPRPRPHESLSPKAPTIVAPRDSAASAQAELETLNSAEFLADRDLPLPAQGLRILLQDQALQPVSSAEISLYDHRTDVPLPPGSIPAPDTRKGPLLVCRTTTGIYDFAKFPRSKFVMVVQADHLQASAWFEHLEQGSTHVVTLEPARSVTIRAVDSSNRPVAGVRVQPTAIFALAEPKRTDAEGRATWPLDPADPALFYASQFRGRAFRDDTGASFSRASQPSLKSRATAGIFNSGSWK